MVYYGDTLYKWNCKLFLQMDFAAARNGLPMDAMAVIDHVLLDLKSSGVVQFAAACLGYTNSVSARKPLIWHGLARKARSAFKGSQIQLKLHTESLGMVPPIYSHIGW